MRLPILLAVSFLLGAGACATDSNSGECLPGDVPCELDHGVGGKADGKAVVPDCQDFDLVAAISAQHDNSPNYQCTVSPGLDRSSQPDTRWIQSLSNPAIRERPFKAVVNLRGESGANGEAPAVRDAHMTPLNIPVPDQTAPTQDQVIQFLSFVTDPKNQPVDVHCKAGQGRTGTFVATYRMAVQGWSPDDAIAEAKKFRCSPVQIQFLERFATHLGDPQIKAFLHAPGS